MAKPSLQQQLRVWIKSLINGYSLEIHKSMNWPLVPSVAVLEDLCQH